jgi:hypothetical protein
MWVSSRKIMLGADRGKIHPQFVVGQEVLGERDPGFGAGICEAPL